MSFSSSCGVFQASRHMTALSFGYLEQSMPLSDLKEVLARLPRSGNDPGLNFGDLAQSNGRVLEDLPCLLSLTPQLLSRLPGTFICNPQLLSRLPDGFRVSSYALLLLPQLLCDTPYVFGAEPVGSRVFPVHLRLLPTSFGPLTLCFRVLAAWLIGVHTPSSPSNLPFSDKCNLLRASDVLGASS